jgi:signal recognition particle subunit SRP72
VDHAGNRSICSKQSSPEHPDILENLSATSAHLDFDSHGYHTHLNAPPPADPSASSSQVAHIPTEADLESYVPSLPAGWAVGGINNVKKTPVLSASTNKGEGVTKKRKRKHKLPKGASESKPFNGDVSHLFFLSRHDVLTVSRIVGCLCDNEHLSLQP